MRITSKVVHWSAPVKAYPGHVCDVDATTTLLHSTPNRQYRKNAPAVVVCATTVGTQVALCSHCQSYVESAQWLAKIGSTEDLSEGRLAALAYVWRSELGFIMPVPDGFPGGLRALGSVRHHLARLVSEGLVKKIGNRYLMRDACPSCFRRGGCAAECMLHMGKEFAPRREAQLQ